MAFPLPATPAQTGAQQPHLRLRDLSGSVDGAGHLQGLSLDVSPGEFLALLGSEGAGGSAALMLLAGLAVPEAGEIQFDGRPLAHTTAHRRGFGVVLRDAALLPHLTLAQNVALPLRARGRPRAACAEPVRQMLDLVGLSAAAERKPGEVAPVALIRAALARALVFAPRLLLLDDPFALLDRPDRMQLQRELRGWHERLGFTVLLATADAPEAMALADRVAVLASGRLRQCGTALDIYETPANAFVAGFVGESNMLPGSFVRTIDDLAEIHLDCGLAVEARPVDAARGQRCVMAVRPERVALAAITAEEMGDGALPAVVEEVVYQGDHARLRLRIGAPGAPPARLVVRRPAGAPMAGLEPGLPVALAWQPYHAAAFRPEPV